MASYFSASTCLFRFGCCDDRFPMFFFESLVKDGQRSFRFIFPKSYLNNKLQEELVEPWHPGHVRGNGPEQDGIEMGCQFVLVKAC